MIHSTRFITPQFGQIAMNMESRSILVDNDGQDTLTISNRTPTFDYSGHTDLIREMKIVVEAPGNAGRMQEFTRALVDYIVNEPGLGDQGEAALARQANQGMISHINPGKVFNIYRIPSSTPEEEVAKS